MLESFQAFITPFNLHRTVRVYLPPSYYQEDKSYPVLYFHDGQNVFQDKDAVGGISLRLEEFLNEHGLEIIVVGIDSNIGEERVNEYCPWENGEYSRKITGNKSALGGKGEAYLDFIVNELKPFIDNKYRTLDQSTFMAGISLGGLISTYAMCRYPNIFTRVVAISSAYYRNQEEIERLIKNTNLSSVERFYLDCGTKEAGKEEGISKEFLASNKAIYELLKNEIAETRLEIVKNAEHNYVHFKERIPEIFAFLFSDSR
ncbi:alpha/beta hydrolase [Cytobacillus depressus]|uniref:Alpha/beta hydrolase n=1 Tax=Cytobacillus depressus TaxID=1602942 RepID=A0A6L3V372_9BACI|nr:alpha/beta hydrolase-fold protein [Cytobacillus depressus]KAB2334400.1 alpha/beta hydrolase [Cytobacillus depressus]